MEKITQVPLLDLKRYDSDYEAEIQNTFTRVFRSGYFILAEIPEKIRNDISYQLRRAKIYRAISARGSAFFLNTSTAFSESLIRVSAIL